MLKKAILALLIFIGSVFIVSCANQNSIRHSEPSIKDQCLRLKHEQMFVRTHRHDMEHWQYETKRKRLKKTFQTKGCYRVLR